MRMSQGSRTVNKQQRFFLSQQITHTRYLTWIKSNQKVSPAAAAECKCKR